VVDTVFGLPGDGINGLIEGFRRQQEKIRWILVQHEEVLTRTGRSRRATGVGAGGAEVSR
jgi:glyoxylate carboligase